VRLRVGDIAPHGYAIDRAMVRQRKTGRPVKFEISEHTRMAVDNHNRANPRTSDDFLFVGRKGTNQPLTTRQYARLVSQWVSSVSLDASLFGTHSLRRTKATLIYRRTGNLRAVQLLLGHSKIESTVRYLGIEVDDALDIAEKVDI
jgi:integrase